MSNLKNSSESSQHPSNICRLLEFNGFHYVCKLLLQQYLETRRGRHTAFAYRCMTDRNKR